MVIKPESSPRTSLDLGKSSFSKEINSDNGKYISKNYYWKSYNINDLINGLSIIEQKDLMLILSDINKSYKILSTKYQLLKTSNKIPLK